MVKFELQVSCVKLRVELQRAITGSFGSSSNGFELQIERRRNGGLHKEVAHVLLQVRALAECVGLVMKLTGADRSIVVDAGDDCLIRKGIIASDNPGRVELRLIAFEQRRELVEAGPGRTSRRDYAEVCNAQARLHRVDVDVLQELRLEQLARPRDLAARLVA